MALFCLFAIVLSADDVPGTQGSRILGRDLAIADSRFSALPASLAIGFAPTPGTKRVFSGAELSRIARDEWHLAGPVPVRSALKFRCVRTDCGGCEARHGRSLGAESELNIVELQKIDIPDGEHPVSPRRS